MLYNDLDKIPLDTFIDVFIGDKNKLIIKGEHSEEELSGQSEKLITEYVEIIGGSSVIAGISRESNLLNLHAKVECLQAAEIMSKSGMWEEASSILASFGYRIPANEHEKIIKRISSVLASTKYMIDRAERLAGQETGLKMDNDYFARERVAVMAHFSMQIRKGEISAKEYAYLVRRMCDEIKLINKQRKEK